MRKRAVVTGMGWVMPMGTDLDSAWKRILAGESGVGRITIFDARNFTTQIAAEVRDWDLSQAGEDPQRWKYQGRHTRFAVGAAKAAVASAGLQEGDVEPTRFGVYMGSGEGNQEFERFTTMVVGALTGEE